MTSEIEAVLADLARRVEETLEHLLPGPDEEPKRLHQAVRWSVFAGGKRVRPAIVFLVGQTFGADLQTLSRTAAAVEMIHSFSLIHDDLPSMDDDDLRRGRLTCHKKFDEATAILAGDALQVLAFKTIAEDEAITVEQRVRLVAEFATASGTPHGMVAGQQLDLEAEGLSISADDLETIHRRKTGALIVASARAGALIAGASPTEILAVEEYAGRLGLLFQITDDLLDVTQATEVLGKTAGKDVRSEKATYPSQYGHQATRSMASQVSREACSALDALSVNTDLLRSLSQLILDRTR